MAWRGRKKQPSVLTPAQFRAVMVAIYGTRNKIRFAKALGYSPPHLDKLLKGTSPINREITMKCHDLTRKQAVELFRLAANIETKITEHDASITSPRS